MINDEQNENDNNKEKFEETAKKNLLRSESTEDIVKNINKLKNSSKVDYAAKYKDRINNDVEEKQLIRKMQEMEDKNDKRNSLVMIVTFVVIGIIVIWLLIKTFSTPLASLLGENKKNKLDDNSTPITGTNPTANEKKPDVKENAIYNYCLSNDNMDKVNKQATLINNNDPKGITAIFITEILRNNGYDIPNQITNTKLLVEKLQALGWQKHTKPEELQKGDIAFTTEMTGMEGFPSHVYVFMGWVQPTEFTDGLVCDSLKDTNENAWVHKRNISYETEQKQKMVFFMKAPATAPASK